MQRRPNIVIFNPDSYRGDVLGHLGNHGAVTPHLDAFVKDGAVSYANAFAQNPVCTPSRCSFMTGLYPHVHGHRSMKHMLRAHEPYLFSLLRQQGYHVWWGGKNDLVAVRNSEEYLAHCDTKFNPPKSRGTRTLKQISPDDPKWNLCYRGVYDGHGEDWPHLDHDGGCVRGAADFIATAPDSQPFCIFLPLSNPHPAYAVERDFYDRIDPARLPPRLPVPAHDHAALDQLRAVYQANRLSEDDWTLIRRVYYAMCCKVDDLFGRVVAALKSRGVYDNTLIVFLSDHGDFTGDYALPEKTHHSLQDCLLRVPLIVRPPAGTEVSPGVRRSLVELVDLCPAVYDLLGVDAGYDTQGKSLRASLAGDDRPNRACVFAEVGSRRGERSFINQDVFGMPPDNFYRLQSRASHDAHRRGSYAVSARSLDYKYIRRGYDSHHELYDLRQDPGELHNLYGQPAFADVEREMSAQLLEHFITTADVLPRDVDSRQV